MRLGTVAKKNLMPSIEPGEPMTLAQTLGLIPRPPPLLTESEWDEVHVRARLRQDDAREECPICQERFKTDTQVLLSCSHVYHKQCLASYERYARTRACPLCRAQQYQRIEIDDGARAYRNLCALVIQSFYRGHLARRRFKELKRHNPPKYSEALRRKWAAERLEEESKRLITEMEGERGDIDDLFAELDRGLEQSRAACDAVDSRRVASIYLRLERQEEEDERHRMDQRIDSEAPDEEQGGEGTRGRDVRGEGVPSSPADDHPPVEAASIYRSKTVASEGSSSSRLLPSSTSEGRDEVDWGSILAKGKERQAAGEESCPICIGPIGRRGQSGVAWLSCSHAFHVNCIRAFEAFELANNSTPSCPVCRTTSYKRRCFD
jgi:hypothetical protein